MVKVVTNDEVKQLGNTKSCDSEKSENFCSAMIMKLPPKFKDPGSITITFFIWVVSVSKALIDLGANINLMSLSMCRRIGNLEIDPTRMTLQLAYCSITRPFGVVKDVLSKSATSPFWWTL